MEVTKIWYIRVDYNFFPLSNDPIFALQKTIEVLDFGVDFAAPTVVQSIELPSKLEHHSCVVIKGKEDNPTVFICKI